MLAVVGTVGKLCFSTFRKTKHFLFYSNFRRRKTANIVRTLIKNRTLSERELTKSGSKCQISRKWSDASPQNFNSAQRKYSSYFVPILVQISRYMTFHLIYPWNVSAYKGRSSGAEQPVRRRYLSLDLSLISQIKQIRTIFIGLFQFLGPCSRSCQYPFQMSPFGAEWCPGTFPDMPHVFLIIIILKN